MILLVRPTQSLAASLANFRRSDLHAVGIALQQIEFDDNAIEYLSSKLESDTNVSTYKPFNFIIVTSQYAAQGLTLALKEYSLSPEDIAETCIAIGNATARELNQQFPNLSIVIPEKHNSEGVLALPHLISVANQSIGIFKGHEGRDVLQTELLARHGDVESHCLYSRTRLDFDFAQLARQMQSVRSDKHVLAVTSGEAAQIILDSPSAHFLKQISWVVISERIAKLVKEQGVNSVTISAGASDEALIKCIRNLME